MIFTHPLVGVVALAASVLYLIVQYFGRCSSRSAAHAYSSLCFMSAALCSPSWPQRFRDVCRAAAVGMFIAGCGGPHAMIPSFDGATIVFCIDTSGSMRTADMDGSRAMAAIKALQQFVIASTPETRIGLISFAGTAHLLALPTTDRRMLKRAIAHIPEPNGQTAIGDALELAERIMPLKGLRAIVLITDGVNNRGSDPATAVAHLRASRIVLDTLRRRRNRFDAPSNQMRAFRRIDLGPWAGAAGAALLGLAWLLGITAGRFPFLGEPEAREQLEYSDGASSLRRSGRYGDWHRSNRGTAHMD